MNFMCRDFHWDGFQNLFFLALNRNSHFRFRFQNKGVRRRWDKLLNCWNIHSSNPAHTSGWADSKNSHHTYLSWLWILLQLFSPFPCFNNKFNFVKYTYWIYLAIISLFIVFVQPQTIISIAIDYLWKVLSHILNYNELLLLKI